MSKLLNAIFILFLFSAVVQAEHRYAIPLTAPGSSIYVENDEPQTNHVMVTNGKAVYDYTQRPHTTYLMAGKEPTFVTVTSEFPVKAWTYVSGAMFEAKELLLTRRMLTITDNSGIAIANPWDTPNSITFYLYVNEGYAYEVEAMLVPNGSITQMANMLFPFLHSGPTVIMVISEKPLAIGVARASMDGKFETIPVN